MLSFSKREFSFPINLLVYSLLHFLFIYLFAIDCRAGAVVSSHTSKAANIQRAIFAKQSSPSIIQVVKDHLILSPVVVGMVMQRLFIYKQPCVHFLHLKSILREP